MTTLWGLPYEVFIVVYLFFVAGYRFLHFLLYLRYVLRFLPSLAPVCLNFIKFSQLMKLIIDNLSFFKNYTSIYQNQPCPSGAALINRDIFTTTPLYKRKVIPQKVEFTTHLERNTSPQDPGLLVRSDRERS